LRRRDGKRPHRVGPDLRQREREDVEYHGHMTREEILDSRRSAPVGHMDNVNAGNLFDLFSHDVSRAAIALRGKSQLARIGFGIGDEIGERLCRDGRVDDKDR